MRRLLLLTACILVWTAGFAQKFSAVNDQGTKIKYEVVSAQERTVRMTGADKTEELIIPENVVYKGETYTITVIGEYSVGSRMSENKVTKKVSLPLTVKEIENNAFYACDALNMINIPPGIKKMSVRRPRWARHGRT